MEPKNRVLLIVLDGFGLAAAGPANAISEARPEFIEKLFRERPCTRLACSGLDVGLPEGQMGNSEVGHLNLGAGRVVYQDFTRINLAIEDGSFFQNPALLQIMDRVLKAGTALHLIGLVSDGGVHSHVRHLEALVEMARRQGLTRVFIHALTDGRDTSPTSGVHFIKGLTESLARIGCGRIASIGGRYFAMDRDRRWERVEKAYLALVHGVGHRAPDPVTAMEASYRANITDEFVVPVVIEEKGQPVATIGEGDGVIAFNFRADRMRQLTHAFTDRQFDGFQRKELNLHYASFTQYEKGFAFPVAFPPIIPERVLAEVLAARQLPQLHVAETEKYAHVTFFFNGGREEPFPGEQRILLPSPKVKTYDLKPEMSAFEVGDALTEHLPTQRFPFILVNFANCDMVGHTGSLPAAIKAVQALDCVLSKVVPVAYQAGYTCILTADHGNAEQMVDEATGEPFTEHTVNPVPFCLLSREKVTLVDQGRLCDVAPTVLQLLGLEPPPDMTGRSLLKPG